MVDSPDSLSRGIRPCCAGSGPSFICSTVRSTFHSLSNEILAGRMSHPHLLLGFQQVLAQAELLQLHQHLRRQPAERSQELSGQSLSFLALSGTGEKLRTSSRVLSSLHCNTGTESPGIEYGEHRTDLQKGGCPRLVQFSEADTTRRTSMRCPFRRACVASARGLEAAEERLAKAESSAVASGRLLTPRGRQASTAAKISARLAPSATMPEGPAGPLSSSLCADASALKQQPLSCSHVCRRVPSNAPAAAGY